MGVLKDLIGKNRLLTYRPHHDDPGEVVARGPNWLFVRLSPLRLEGGVELSDRLWAIATRHFVYRMVLELDDLGRLSPRVIQELVELRVRLLEQGGALRLCGLSAECARALRLASKDGALQNHPDRHSAVGDSWCGGPSDTPSPDNKPHESTQAERPMNPLPTKPR